MFPYFLGLNIDSIKESLFKPIFELLVTKFTAKGEYPTLSKLSLDVGIEIIKKNAQRHAPLLLQILEGFINQATGVSNIIFLGVLAPFLEANKNLQIIERRITELFKGKNEDEQRSISKCMPDLMSFFKQPSQLVDGIYCSIGQISDALQVGQAYLFSGLLKGIGRKESLVYLDRLICEEYVAKSRS